MDTVDKTVQANSLSCVNASPLRYHYMEDQVSASQKKKRLEGIQVKSEEENAICLVLSALFPLQSTID